MINRQNLNGIFSESVNNAVVPEDDLTDSCIAKFRDNPARAREGGEAFNCLEDVYSEKLSILR